MPLVSFLELIPEVQAQAPSAALPSIQHALRRAATEFCQRSEAWRHRPAPMTVTTGTPEVTVGLPEQTMIVKVIRASLDGTKLALTSEVLLDQFAANWRTVSGPVKHLYRSGANQLTVAPLPGATYTTALDVTLALKPIRTATGLDEEVVDRYEKAIVDGALSLLLAQRNQPWGDLELASVYAAQFTAQVHEAYAEAGLDDTAKQRTTTYGGY